MRLFPGSVLLLVLVSVASSVPAFAEEWIAAGAQGSANPAGARAHEIGFLPAAGEIPRAAAAERIPRPMRYFEPEPAFSPLKERAQQDTAIAGRDFQPADATAVIKNFAGISYHGSSPSDSTIAVGPQHVVIAVNTSIAIYQKGGGKLVQRNFNDFFSAFTEVQGADFFDPKLAYDQLSGHFIFNVDAIRDRDNRSWCMLVVSKTSNLSDGWIGWALDMQLNGAAHTKFWADYPQMGYDSQAVYLTANMYNKAGNFQYAKLRILRKSELYQFNASLGWYDFWQLHDATGPKTFTLQPVRTVGLAGAEYLVSCNSSQGAAVTLWSLANASSSSPQLSKRKINVPSFSDSYANAAQQKGGGSRLDVDDARLSDAVFRDGTILVSHTIQKDWGSGNVSAIRLYRLSESGTLLEGVTFGADGAYYFYPALTTDGKGNLILVFDRSSSSEFAGVRFTIEPAGTSDFQQSTSLKPGLANYFWQPDDRGVERWGDYSGIANDPSDSSVWVHSQYADVPSREWTGRVGRLRY